MKLFAWLYAMHIANLTEDYACCLQSVGCVYSVTMIVTEMMLLSVNTSNKFKKGEVMNSSHSERRVI